MAWSSAVIIGKIANDDSKNIFNETKTLFLTILIFFYVLYIKDQLRAGDQGLVIKKSMKITHIKSSVNKINTSSPNANVSFNSAKYNSVYILILEQSIQP